MFKRASKPSAEQLDHERLTSLINSMADGVLAVDQNMNIVLSNGAALNVLDLNSSLRGKKLGSVLKPQDKNGQPLDIEQLVYTTKTSTTNRDLLLHYDDGSKINLYLSIAPVHLGYGKSKSADAGFVILLRDITHEKSLEEERDEFISVVSHELRTPIAITEGNISNAQFVVAKTTDTKMIKEALRQAHEQVLFLADMINDLATLSRAERGKLTMEIEPIDIQALITELQTSYEPRAKAKKLTFTSQVKPGVSELHSSKLYVREILQNFITNAIKYTEHGSITITVEKATTGTRFTVADTGIGVSKGDQEKLFDKFFRSEDYRTRKTNGTGLGLYITMKLARLLHAEIDVQSELDKGSTFTITIPDLGEK